ncbi:MAG TPA: ZIP family metal transporter [Desulfotomaculum sp.]|nr:MAG: Zinc/iron permease [Desulfotomaculum sp. 46_80]HAG10375.1 ZIP family metal transporter [Desulfotomaculum sp.]HBY04164.1 ZIP family metal transporter [Desulfotomaculum sp.]
MGKVLFMGLIAGLGTCLGALIILSFHRIKYWQLSLMLGFASGAMLALTFLDLIPAALYQSELSLCLKGCVLSLIVMGSLDFLLNRSLLAGSSGHRYTLLGYFIALGIALHDLPEGFAIAAGAAEPISLGTLLTLTIGLHNIPEGMAMSAPLRVGGMGAFRIMAINFLISLVTPLGSALGMILIKASPAFISLLLAFAAGSMLYIVILKLLPEAFRGRWPASCLGILLGIILVIFFNLFF